MKDVFHTLQKWNWVQVAPQVERKIHQYCRVKTLIMLVIQETLLAMR